MDDESLPMGEITAEALELTRAATGPEVEQVAQRLAAAAPAMAAMREWNPRDTAVVTHEDCAFLLKQVRLRDALIRLLLRRP